MDSSVQSTSYVSELLFSLSAEVSPKGHQVSIVCLPSITLWAEQLLLSCSCSSLHLGKLLRNLSFLRSPGHQSQHVLSTVVC